MPYPIWFKSTCLYSFFVIWINLSCNCKTWRRMNAFIIALISISLPKHSLGAKIFNLDLATFHLNAEFRVQGDRRRARSSHLSRICRILILSFVNIRKISQNGIVFWRFEQSCGRNTKRFSLSNMWWFRKTWKKTMVSVFQYAPNMSKLQSDLQRKWEVFLRTTNFKWILQDDWIVAECERPKVQLHQYETWL